MFNNEQLLVMCNIIAALESEGQVYHTRETANGYGAFAEAYENSGIEHSITLSRYQFFATEGQKLLKMIYQKDSSLFTDELVNDLFNADWNTYSISRNSSKGQTIIKIISSDVGKECADELIGQQLQEYCQYVEQYGVTDVQAQALAVNWIHHGGKGAFTRILAKTPKPYTLDNLYNASKSDTGNQVGAYVSRQRACYNMIKQYMPVEQPTEQSETTYEITPGTTAEDILNIMRGWIGLNEQDGSYMEILNLYNSHTPRARGYAIQPYDEWCDCTISALFIKANAVDLIGGTEVGVEEHVKLFKNKGIWNEDGSTSDVRPGDIIVFSWSKAVQPNDNYSSHIGIVEYVEDGIIHTIEGNANEMVKRRTYPIGHGNIRGFARPAYSTNSSTAKVKETVVTDIQSPLRKGSFGENVAKMQTLLIELGYDCAGYGADGDFGNGTEASLKLFQRQHGLKETGVYSIADKAQLEKSYTNSKSETLPQEMFTIKDPKSYLRTGPSQNKEIKDRLPVGTKVTAIKSHINKAGNKWFKVEYDSASGWIVAKSLTV